MVIPPSHYFTNLSLCIGKIWTPPAFLENVEYSSLLPSSFKGGEGFNYDLTRISNCLVNTFSCPSVRQYMPKAVAKFGNLLFLPYNVLQLKASYLVMAYVCNAYFKGNFVFVTGVPLFIWHCVNVCFHSHSPVKLKVKRLFCRQLIKSINRSNIVKLLWREKLLLDCPNSYFQYL